MKQNMGLDAGAAPERPPEEDNWSAPPHASGAQPGWYTPAGVTASGASGSRGTPGGRGSSSGGLRVGRYELLSRLAAGGMGEVFIARPQGTTDPEERVAVKLLLPHLSARPEFVQMFLDEARIAARMNHPNVVRIFDLGEWEGRYYVAMTLVEGVSLSALFAACREQRVMLSIPVARLIVQGLCAALMHAHNLRDPSGRPFNLIHRDVTPHNVLISTSGQVVLTDFGIAKASDNIHHTRTGVVRGKYAYIAPEQLSSPSSGKVDQRADLFSAAVTLFETFTLLSPFSREGDLATMDAIRNDPVPDLLALRSDVTAELKSAFDRALERDPDRRYQTARELSEALMQGPLAKPEELGEVVRMLCEGDLRAFHDEGRVTAPEASRVGGTAALPALVSDTLAGAVGPPPKRFSVTPPVAIAALAVLSFLAAAAYGWHRLSNDAQLQEVDARPLGPIPGRLPARQEGTGAPVDRGSGAAVQATGTERSAAPTSGESRPVGSVASTGVADSERTIDVASSAAAADEAMTGSDSSSDAEETDAPAASTTAPRQGTSGAAATVGADALEDLTGPLRVGYLAADASPWAEVLVDGEPVERTPLSHYPLRVGAHLVVFRNPALGRIEKRITIVEGQVSRVRVTFPRR